MSRPRVLIFIVAYNAETTIANVLSRIPEGLRDYDTEVLIIDDSSGDRTFHTAMEHGTEAALPFKLTVLFNPVNQGYGGNQKIGFHYAIENGFDAVALLHGDGQYAPERLPDLIAPVAAGEADLVLGSRMLDRGGALKGGMPLYKFVGNKILTAFQNRLLGSALSEFHTGYRVYAVRALKAVPFSLNTNDFHFDTEIIIQLMLAGRPITELPIPTYYGNEICYVDGPRYAKDVVKATVLARIQGWGLLYQRRFDVARPDPAGPRYQPKLDFDSSHTAAADDVADGAAVLDLGCGDGHVARVLRDRGCSVTGVDAVAPQDQSPFHRFMEADLDEDACPVPLDGIDHVLLLDVIEYLKDPDQFLDRLAAAAGLHPELRLTVSAANVAFFIPRLTLLLGGFNYSRRGILEHGHKRLFTFGTLKTLFEQHGFQVHETRGIPAPYPLALGPTRWASALLAVNRWLIALSKGAFSYQIMLRASPRPSLSYLLRSAHETAGRLAAGAERKAS